MCGFFLLLQLRDTSDEKTTVCVCDRNIISLTSWESNLAIKEVFKKLTYFDLAVKYQTIFHIKTQAEEKVQLITQNINNQQWFIK